LVGLAEKERAKLLKVCQEKVNDILPKYYQMRLHSAVKMRRSHPIIQVIKKLMDHMMRNEICGINFQTAIVNIVSSMRCD